jgi:hypothetical protein
VRAAIALLPLLIVAAPCAAQRPAPAQAAPAVQLPSQLTDPAMADRLANVMQALSKAFLNLPAGEIQAAVEGRKPNASERRMTVRDLGRRTDPNFERKVQQQLAKTKPMIEQNLKTIISVLPSMMQSLEQAGRSLERAATNVPDPTYPKR